MKSKILGFTAILFALTLAFAFKPRTLPCPSGFKFVQYKGTAAGSDFSAANYTVRNGANFPCDAGAFLCGFCVPDNSTYFSGSTLIAIPGSEAAINIQAELTDFHNGGSHHTDILVRSTDLPLP